MLSTRMESEAVVTLERARARIDAALRQAENAVVAVVGCFQDLARESASVLELAAEIIGCIESDEVRSVLPCVQALGEAAQGFIHGRLQATGSVLEMVAAEASLLERLSKLTRGQRSIARETQTLSVLTNIEVARLGALGAGFQYLAHQLDEFSQSVANSTKQLATHTEERQSSIIDTRRRLAAALPRVQKEFARIEGDLEGALKVAYNSHHELARAPEHFQSVVAEIAGQIAGVVAAVQGHDITRQQLEHVRDGLGEILRRMDAPAAEDEEVDALEEPLLASGLGIQVYQLRSIEQVVSGWLGRIGDCAGNILRISTSEVTGIGPAVLRQERELSEQLGRIERLEQECEADSAEVQATFEGLSNLMQLVGEHVARSHEVQERLQLLTFNSIVEASHLGTQADAILEISQSIKRIAGEWSELTARSAEAKNEILALVEQTRGSMESFSGDGVQPLRAAQQETRIGLEKLRAAASCAATRAERVEAATATLQSRIAAVSEARDRLEASFTALTEIQSELQALQSPAVGAAAGRADFRQAETIFGGSYTTELEREVLRAALQGAPLPAADQHLEGNDVELF